MEQDLTQYAADDIGSFAIGKTQRKLPTGIFEIVSTKMGYRIRPKEFATDELIVIPDAPSALVTHDIQTFWDREELFRDYGFTHKRGVLLYGPPGSGKTSVTNLVSTRIQEMGGLVLYASTAHPSYTANALAAIREVEPNRRVLLVLEDVEVLVRANEETLLSILDGQDTIDNMVVLATTNYIEKLPDRLIKRPSRFDRVVYVGAPSAAVRAAYLMQKGRLSGKNLETWVAATDGLMIAHLKELIISVICLGNDLAPEVTRLQQWKPGPGALSEIKVVESEDDDGPF